MIDLPLETILIVFAGALAGGIVNGLTGFGTGLTALGIWLYVLEPTTASSLVIISSIASQLQTLRLVWHAIERDRVAVFVVPGIIGVPIGTLLLPVIDPQLFKAVVGLILVAYAGYALLRRRALQIAWGGAGADGVVGFLGGVLGGLAGISGVFPVIWTDIRGWSKDRRRGILQCFNTAILVLALGSHAVSGLLDLKVGTALVAALPGTIGGAQLGAYIYRRLTDRLYQRAILVLLLLSGALLLWSSR